MDLKRLIKRASENGPRAIGPALKYAAFRMREKRKYQAWIKANALNDARRAEMRSQMAEFSQKPQISVVVPVYDVDERWLRKCLDSVKGQIYTDWQLCIADDHSPSPHIRRTLDEYASADERIKVIYRSENGNISAASNSALDLAEGEFTVLLDHDDELAEDALFWVAKEIDERPEADLIYSDEDKIDEHGRRSEPKFKPDWSRDLFYSLNLVTHLSCFRTSILKEIRGFRENFEGSQDYDLTLRFIERIDERNIRHIPRILYHWRAIEGSVALSGDEKPYAHERARNALREHFERLGVPAAVEPAFQNMHRVRYEMPADPPKVTLIIWGAEASKDNALGPIEYSNYEVKMIAGRTANDMNRAAAGDADVICFIRAGLVPRREDWLAEMVGFAVQPGIGVVGGKAISGGGAVRHAGFLINANGVEAAHFGIPAKAPGNLSRNVLTGNYSALCVECMAVRRDLFESVGGFDGGQFPEILYAADLCLRLLEKGCRNVFTPYAVFVSDREDARGGHAELETERFKKKWAALVERDPFYNPNFSKDDASFSIDI